MRKSFASLMGSATVLAACADFAAAQSNIDPANKFAWCENIGWTNWLDADGAMDGVFVDTSGGFLEGFVWGENTGWINTGYGGPYANTTGLDFGINILGNDDLDGLAWGENIGWINFGWAANTANADRARFDIGANRFRGYAWGENVGWLNLDDGTHFVAKAPQPCLSARDCADFNVCTCDACVANVCQNTPIEYGNVDCSGIVLLGDVLCVLNGYADISTCPNGDIDPPCTGNDPPFIELGDILAVLAAYSGADPCGCQP